MNKIAFRKEISYDRAMKEQKAMDQKTGSTPQADEYTA